MRILKEDVLTLVVDYQEKLMPFIHENEALTEKTVILLEGLRALEVPLLVTEQYPKGLGHTVAPIMKAAGAVPGQVLEKLAFSCYDDTGIRAAVKRSRKSTILLCGIETHICVLQTAIDLRATGYTVLLTADCVSSRSPFDKKIALKRAQKEGVLLTTCEAILFELARQAGTPEFKTISQLVK